MMTFYMTWSNFDYTRLNNWFSLRNDKTFPISALIPSISSRFQLLIGAKFRLLLFSSLGQWVNTWEMVRISSWQKKQTGGTLICWLSSIRYPWVIRVWPIRTRLITTSSRRESPVWGGKGLDSLFVCFSLLEFGVFCHELSHQARTFPFTVTK